ncbi:hypothetical protein ACQRIT_002918 [Beauveria bassiana]
MDIEVVYGKDVKQLFKTPWNTWVADVDVIYPESTYNVSYMTTLPTAAIAASISWSANSTDTATTTMFLKVPKANFHGKLSVKFGHQHNTKHHIDFTPQSKPGIGTEFNAHLFNKCAIGQLSQQFTGYVIL